MSWRWTKKEVIWNMLGAKTTGQGGCSMFKGNIPQSCVRKPTVVDLLPGTPFNQQIANCCKSGVLKPGSESAFQLSVGSAGNSVKTARMPANFMFTAPKQQYICGPSKNVRPTRFTTADKRRITAALSKFHNKNKPRQICNSDFETHLLLFLFLCSDLEHYLRLPQSNMNNASLQRNIIISKSFSRVYMDLYYHVWFMF